MINWGIIGVGNIAHRFIQSLAQSKNGQLIAVASKNPETKKRYPMVHVYSEYNELLDDDQIDIVYIASPHQTHIEWIKKALLKGKHVLCEKPASLHAQEMIEVCQLSKQNNLFFMEAFKTKFSPALMHLKDSLQGEKILSIEAQFCFDAPKNESRYLYDPIQGGALYDVNTYLAGFVQFFIDNPSLIAHNVTWKDGIDTSFEYQLKAEDTKVNLKGSIENSLDRYANITSEHYNIHIPNFHRATCYSMNEKTIEIPFIYDDMSGEIEEAHRCINHNWYESPIHSHQNTINLISLTELLKNTSFSEK